MDRVWVTIRGDLIADRQKVQADETEDDNLVAITCELAVQLKPFSTCIGGRKSPDRDSTDL